jgi:serine/threonine-protein kinase
VTLSVSNGVASQVTLPDVVGLQVNDAEAELAAIHISVSTVSREVVGAKRIGVVLSMDPAAGSVVSEGTTVQLVVGVAPAGSPSPSGSPSPP